MTLCNRIVAFLIGAGASAAAVAGTVDLNLNNDVIEGSYATDPTTYQVRLGALRDATTHDWLAHAGFIVVGEHVNPSVRSHIGVGGRVYAGSSGPSDVVAIPLGGEFDFYPGDSAVGVGGYAFYAPNVLSGLDAQNFLDAGARVEVEVIKPTAVVYVGYRRVQAKFKDIGTVKIDSGVNVGLRLRF
jgi:hypothetical protein